jgi:putative transposase
MIEGAADVFKGSHAKEESASSIESEKLYAQIGQLKVENDFLKKCAEIGDKRHRLEMISPRNKSLSIRRQCEILAVSRSSLYYAPRAEKPEN